MLRPKPWPSFWRDHTEETESSHEFRAQIEQACCARMFKGYDGPKLRPRPWPLFKFNQKTIQWEPQWASFSGNCRAVYVVFKQYLCSQFYLKVMSISVCEKFLDHKEIRGSGHCATKCSSEPSHHIWDLRSFLMVQPICICKQTFSYSRDAQSQFFHPLGGIAYCCDQATYLSVEHAKKRSETVHAEQVYYRGVQSYSRCMMPELEGAELCHVRDHDCTLPRHCIRIPLVQIFCLWSLKQNNGDSYFTKQLLHEGTQWFLKVCACSINTAFEMQHCYLPAHVLQSMQSGLYELVCCGEISCLFGTLDLCMEKNSENISMMSGNLWLDKGCLKHHMAHKEIKSKRLQPSGVVVMYLLEDYLRSANLELRR